MPPYADIYKSWQTDPEAFWMNAARAIDWIKPPSKALFDENAPFYQWYADGEVNTCYNALDRHVESGRADQIALYYDSPITDTKEKYTYRQMRDLCAQLAGGLQAQGVKKGDRVLIYMPMVAQSVMAMLACARIGAIHSVVFGGFAAKELAVRIDDATPKAIIAASCGIEPSGVIPYKPLLDGAIELATHKPDFCVILQRPQQPCDLITPRDLDWHDFQADCPPAECVAVKGSDPLYILYTSGTTGQPKGVIRPNGGHLVSLHWTMKSIYNVEPGEVFWAASDVGWVVGHSYICYAPLIHGNATIVFEGKPIGTPDAGTFWRIIQEYDVSVLFTAPTAFRAIKRADPKAELLKDYDISCLRGLYLAGERADPDTIEWAQTHMGVPVIDHWWQTETGFAIAANPVGIEFLPIKIGSPSVAMPGYDVQILDSEGGQCAVNELGAVAIKLPLPPGTLPTLWKADARYVQAYLSRFDGYYETGDAGYVDADGYLYIMARTDDVINVAGHRLSTGQMEEVLAAHPDVAECAVVGVEDALKGQLPLGFVCLNAGVTRAHEDIIAECVARVRNHIGPVAAFKKAVVIERLPKTRSGKILRGIMAGIAQGSEWTMPATIDDPAILEEIRVAVLAISD
ncbi:MAG: propionyl-CoA synthetase [Candidatus Halichondribacter symbioticus]